MIRVMPLFFLSLEPGSDTYLYQETLYRSESCRRRLRKTAPCGSPGMATQGRQAYRRRYWCSSIYCRSTWQLSSAPSPPYNLRFMIGMPNRCCIFELRPNQCFYATTLVCLGAKAKLRRRKPIVLVALAEISEMC